MAGREELVDAIAGFALFADLTARSSRASSTLFEEAVFAEGEKVLRQGLTGSGVLRHPRRRGGDRRRRRRSAPASAAATSSARSRSSSARRRSPTSSRMRPLRCLVLAGPARRGVPDRPPAGDVPDAPGAGPPAASREPMAELSAPVPAGRLPGRRHRERAGRLQVSYSLRRLGRRPRGHLGRPVARRHVPALAVLPAPAVVDQAARPGRARDRAPTSATTGTACSARSRTHAPSSRR